MGGGGDIDGRGGTLMGGGGIGMETPIPAPQYPHRSGSHSRTARKHGQCLVLQQPALLRQRQPGNLCWQSTEQWQYFSQKFLEPTQGQDASHGLFGWSHGW